MSEEIRQDRTSSPSDSSLSLINEQGLWVERKVFRRLLSLMAQSAHGEQDVAHLISIRTREIAQPWSGHARVNGFVPFQLQQLSEDHA